MCLWVDTGEANTTAFTQVALRHEVMLLPGNTYCVGERGHAFLRLAFGAGEADICEALERLCRAWDSYRDRSAHLQAAV